MRQLIQSARAYRLLKTECAENRLNHSYLLVFDDARNLRIVLREFAKLFFLSPDQARTERIAARIDEENFADCMFFPEKEKKFTVEDAEKIREESALKPVEGNRKLFVIGDFAEATVQAQNKLLKLLEEPPENVCFLLGATVTFPVLPTVLSRAQRLEISPFSVKEVTECLKRLYPQEPNTELYAAASGGVIGEAQNILEGGYYKNLVETAFTLVTTNIFNMPSVVRQAGETKYKKELVSLLRLIYRDALILKTAKLSGVKSSEKTGKNRAEKYLLLRSESQRLYEISESHRLETLLYAQKALSEAEKQIRFNGVFSQCLEICLANIFERNNK